MTCEITNLNLVVTRRWVNAQVSSAFMTWANNDIELHQNENILNQILGHWMNRRYVVSFNKWYLLSYMGKRQNNQQGSSDMDASDARILLSQVDVHCTQTSSIDNDCLASNCALDT